MAEELQLCCCCLCAFLCVRSGRYRLLHACLGGLHGLAVAGRFRRRSYSRALTRYGKQALMFAACLAATRFCGHWQCRAPALQRESAGGTNLLACLLAN